MEKIDTEVGKIHERMTEHDQSDFEALPDSECVQAFCQAAGVDE